MDSRHVIAILLILIVNGECATTLDKLHGTCNGSFSCGSISGFTYPFRRYQDPAYCGYPGFELNCDEQNPPTIGIMNITYQVLRIDPTTQILRIVREDMVRSECPRDLVNTTIDHELFDHIPGYMNSSLLFGCPVSFNTTGIVPIFCDNSSVSPVFLLPGIKSPGSCETSVIVPVPIGFIDPYQLGPVIQQGFEVRWKMGVEPCTYCTQSGGQCVYSNTTLATTCACPEPPLLADVCSTTNKTQVRSSPPSGSNSSIWCFFNLYFLAW